MQRAVIMVEEIDLTRVVLTESDDANRWTCDLRHLNRAVGVEAGSPQTTRLPVAKHVSAAELGEFAAAIDVPAGNAGRERVRQRDQRRDDWRGADLLGLDRLRSFHGGPAVI